MKDVEDVVEAINVFREKENLKHVMNYTEGLWGIKDGRIQYGLELLHDGCIGTLCEAGVEGLILFHKGYVIFNGDFGEMTCDEVCTILLRRENMTYDTINYFYPHPEED